MSVNAVAPTTKASRWAIVKGSLGSSKLKQGERENASQASFSKRTPVSATQKPTIKQTSEKELSKQKDASKQKAQRAFKKLVLLNRLRKKDAPLNAWGNFLNNHKWIHIIISLLVPKRVLEASMRSSREKVSIIDTKAVEQVSRLQERGESRYQLSTRQYVDVPISRRPLYDALKEEHIADTLRLQEQLLKQKIDELKEQLFSRENEELYRTENGLAPAEGPSSKELSRALAENMSLVEHKRILKQSLTDLKFATQEVLNKEHSLRQEVNTLKERSLKDRKRLEKNNEVITRLLRVVNEAEQLLGQDTIDPRVDNKALRAAINEKLKELQDIKEEL